MGLVSLIAIQGILLKDQGQTGEADRMFIQVYIILGGKQHYTLDIWHIYLNILPFEKKIIIFFKLVKLQS